MKKKYINNISFPDTIYKNELPNSLRIKLFLYDAALTSYNLIKLFFYYVISRKNINKYFIYKFNFVHLINKLGFYEKSFLDNLKMLVKPGDVAIDIGANAGVYTKSLVEIVGEKGKVFAFDANNFCTDFLKSKFEKYNNVLVFNVGISNINSDNIPFYVPEVYGLFQETAGGSLFEDMASDKSKETTFIKLQTLDSFIDNFNRIDFIKVDIEGAEYEFLEGAVNTIKKFRPIIQIELVGDNDKLRQFMNFVSNIDYNIKRLLNDKLIDIEIDKCDDLNVFLIPKASI